MKKTFILPLLVMLSFSTFAQKIRITEDKENIVASALEGNWIYKNSIKFSFVKDNSIIQKINNKDIDEVIKKISKRNIQKLSDLVIYQAGYTTHTAIKKGKTYGPSKGYYLLTSMHGNPHLVLFRGGKEAPFGDADSFNLYIDKGETSKRDILVIAGNKPSKTGYQFVRILK